MAYIKFWILCLHLEKKKQSLWQVCNLKKSVVLKRRIQQWPFFFFFKVLRIEFRALCMLVKHSTIEHEMVGGQRLSEVVGLEGRTKAATE